MSDTAADRPAAEGGGLDRSARLRQQSPRMTAGKFCGLLLCDASVEVLWEIMETPAYRMGYQARGELKRRGLVKTRDRAAQQLRNRDQGCNGQFGRCRTGPFVC